MNITRIPDLRHKLAWTQERLAEESGVGIRTIQRIESGTDGSLETLSMLALALRVSVRDLFEDIEDLDLISRVESLDARTHHQQGARDRIISAWRWLFIGVGIIVTMLSFMLGGWGTVIIFSYWGGGFLVLRALRSLFLEPMLENKYPLSQSQEKIRKGKTPVA